MFPDRRHRQIPRQQLRRPTPGRQFQGTPPKRENNSPVLQIMNQFKNQNGQYDFTRISGAISQMNKIYDDISPVIRRFTKK